MSILNSLVSGAAGHQFLENLDRRDAWLESEQALAATKNALPRSEARAPALEPVRKMPKQKPGRSKQNYATPQVFIDAVERKWGRLTFDLAAEPDTAKAGHYFTKEVDAFKQDWSKCGDHLWLNPPFGNISRWARTCYRWQKAFQNNFNHNEAIELLVPASVGANWFAKWVWPYADVYALNGRLSFDGKANFPKDCMLCRYTKDSGSSFNVWNWRQG